MGGNEETSDKKEAVVANVPVTVAKKKPIIIQRGAAATKTTATNKGALPLTKTRNLTARVVEDEEDEEEEMKEEEEKSATAATTTKRPLQIQSKKPLLSSKTTKTAVATKLNIQNKQSLTKKNEETVKRPITSFFFFSQATRSQVQSENPGIGLGEIQKKLGHMWKEMSEEEKEPYLAQATADKQRFEQEVAAGGVVNPRKNAAANEKKKNSKPKQTAINGISAYKLFCDDQQSEVKENNPKASKPEIAKVMSELWNELSEEEKNVYVQRAQEMKKKKKKTSDSSDGEEGGDDEPTTKKRGASRALDSLKKKDTANNKRAKRALNYSEHELEKNGVGGDDDGDDDEIDRVNVDWEAHPPVAIISKTATKYIVARQGLPFHDFGEVSVASAKALLCNGTAIAAAPATTATTSTNQGPFCPLKSSHIEEYESFLRTFKRDTFDHTDASEGELVLEKLRSGSTLECCAFLGEMRMEGYELSKLNKKEDIWMKVPMMAMSRVVQRMVEVERKKVQALKEEVATLKNQNKVVGGQGEGKGKIAGEKDGDGEETTKEEE